MTQKVKHPILISRAEGLNASSSSSGLPAFRCPQPCWLQACLRLAFKPQRLRHARAKQLWRLRPLWGRRSPGVKLKGGKLSTTTTTTTTEDHHHHHHRGSAGEHTPEANMYHDDSERPDATQATYR